MTPSKKRVFITRALALALAAVACVVTPGGQAAQSPQGAGRSDDKVSSELRGFVGQTKADTVAVVVQLSAPPSGRLNALLQRSGVRVRGHFAALDVLAVELPAATLAELAGFPEVEWVTRDREVSTAGHVTATIGAEAVRTLPALKGNGSMSVDGAGVGIAVLDSGVYAAHVALKDAGYVVVVAAGNDGKSTSNKYGT